MTDLSNIYFKTIIKKTVLIEPKNQKGDINSHIQKYIREEFEGKCIEEGYVKPNSTEISKRIIPRLVPNVFSGTMYADVKFKADVCLPVKGNIIECKVDKNSKMGLMAIQEPLTIAVPRAFHKDKDAFKDIEIGDTIKVEVIDSRFEINWDHIDVVGRLYNPSKNNKKKNTEMQIIESDENTDLLEDMSDNEKDLLDDNNEGDDDNTLDDEADNNLDDDDIIDEEEITDDEATIEDEDQEVLLDEEDVDEEGNMVGGNANNLNDFDEELNDEEDMEEEDYLEDESVGFESDYGDDEDI